jgi:putative ABC transport system substrate-binding protein
MTRRRCVAAIGLALAAPLKSFAQQQPAKPVRIGFLIPAYASSYASRVEALRAGLRDLGYVEGKPFVMECRVADGNYDRLPELAAELVRLNVDVIVTGGTPGTRAAKRATTTIPIVMAVSGDAVSTGLIASLARPGGNVTGSTYFDPELHAKRLELLKEAIPRIMRVGALINPDNPQAMGTTLQALRLAADALRVELSLFEARNPNEFKGAFSAMVRKPVDAVALVDDPMFLGNLRAIADIAANSRIPSTGAKEFAEAGGLIGYGVDFSATFRRAAYFVDRVIKGTKPGDLPVEQATRFELVINRRAASTLGVTVPQHLLLRADKVIE